MTVLSDLAIFLVCLLPVIASTWFGILRGRRVHNDRKPEKEHLGTIQGALLGLLALLLGFAFSGAMSRFIERQDALYREANAIETAYARADLLPTADRVRAALREYSTLRLQLFNQTVDGRDSDVAGRLQQKYDDAFAATLDGVRQAPGFAAVALGGVEAVNDEFVSRSALSRRHLPMEFVLVMLVCSCVALGLVGYGVGLAENRSIAAAIALAVLVATTLFVTFDFDRPRRGLIRLDPAPLQETAARLNRAPAR